MMTLKRTVILYVVFLLLCTILSNLDVMPEPRELVKQFAPNSFLASHFPHRIPHDDKIAHFFLAGLLSLLVNLSLSCKQIRFRSFSILKGSLFILLMLTLDEWSQRFFPARSASFLDLFAGYAGVFCFGRLALYLKHNREWLEPKFPAAIGDLIWKEQKDMDVEQHEQCNT